MKIVAGQLVIHIIVSIRAISTTIMHGYEFTKAKIRVLPVMLKEMRHKYGQLKELSKFSITQKMNTDHYYNQSFTHS